MCLLLVACDAPAGTGNLVDRAMPVGAELGGSVHLLNAPQRARFALGAARFDSVYTPETGLGPLYNGTSCVQCHHDPKPGGSGAQVGVPATAFRGGVCDELTAVGGPVVQLYMTPALHDALGIDQKPIPPEATGVGYRTTPAMWGSGLLDAVPDSEILALADPDDRDGDGVSGRPNWTAEGKLGRFGRKAQVGTLWDFVSEAYVMEMGITNSVFPVEQTVSGQPLPTGVDLTPDTELLHGDMANEDLFVRWLAPPVPDGSLSILAQARQIFARTGVPRATDSSSTPVRIPRPP
jgi:CxxC motif-containing protein (DUF1111 family)